MSKVVFINDEPSAEVHQKMKSWLDRISGSLPSDAMATLTVEKLSDKIYRSILEVRSVSMRLSQDVRSATPVDALISLGDGVKKELVKWYKARV